MTRILIDGCRIEIDEEILESHFFHTFYGFVRIGIIEIFIEAVNETVLIVARPIVVDKVCEECPDTINSSGISELFLRIENGLVEVCENGTGLIAELLDRSGIESEFREIRLADFSEDLFEPFERLF